MISAKLAKKQARAIRTSAPRSWTMPTRCSTRRSSVKRTLTLAENLEGDDDDLHGQPQAAPSDDMLGVLTPAPL